MLNTSTFVCNHIIHFLMLHNGHLDASKAMYDGMISKIIKHINDDVQTITTHKI